jgi:hypothetical protein
MQELFGSSTFGTSSPSIPSWCKGMQSNAPEHLRVLSSVLQLMQPCAAGRPGVWVLLAAHYWPTFFVLKIVIVFNWQWSAKLCTEGCRHMYSAPLQVAISTWLPGPAAIWHSQERQSHAEGAEESPEQVWQEAGAETCL